MKHKDGTEVPNPGSEEARKQGCKCPVLDNARGQGYMGVPGQFVMSERCPMHWKPLEDLHPEYAGLQRVIT